MSFPTADELNVVVAGVPYGYQGDYSDGRWLTDEHIAQIEGCGPMVRLEHPSVDDLNAGYLVGRKPHAVLVECSGTLKSWESLPAILFESAFHGFLSPELRLVQSCSAGVEQIAGLIPDGVTLCNASGVHAPAIAETVIAAILVHAKLIYRRRAEQRARRWTQLPARELAGTTMCVIGTGHIGSAVAALAQALGMTTVGVRRHPVPTPGFDVTVGPAGLDDALSRADYLVIACPLTADTEGLLTADKFARLPRGAYLANVSRGAVVDEAAMIEAFEQGRLSGGFLDCHVHEPLPDDSPLWDMPGVDISPHDSHASNLLGDRQVELFCRNLKHLIHGEPLVNVVDTTLGY
ncbi:D-2-hydroxyacid dehydrogenase [Mycobacterium sp. SMC-4]|uniref:D-2-hydroxyacid dehydrogenase n=1 Tax=Mycobacterium sp. SMC-4 TaxID=2857059 RepID=UPI003D071CC9